MTKDRATLPAGRDLDALVSRTVMGGDVYPDGGGYYDFMERIGSGQARTLPFYSADLRAVWEVVEKIPFFGMTHMRDGTWHVTFSGEAYAGSAYADTAPLAICRAALAAIGAL